MRILHLTLFGLVLLAGCQSPEQRVDEHMSKAQRFFDEGEVELASVEVRNVLKLDPNRAEAYFLRARILGNREQWKPMFDHLQRALELAPEHVGAHREIAKLYMLGGHLTEAEQHADQVLALAPGEVTSLTLMGAYHLRNGQAGAALQYAEQARANDPADLEAITLMASAALVEQNFELAQATVAEAIERHPEEPLPLVLRSRIAEARGDSPGVAAALEDLIALQPEALSFRRALAVHHLQNDDREAAEQALRQAVAELPESADAKLLLANLLASRSADAAITALRDFIDAEPNSQLSFELGKLYRREGRLDEASLVYQDVAEHFAGQPEALDAHNRLATIALEQRRLEQAQSIVDTVLAEDPNQPEALLLQAYLQLERGETDAVVATTRLVLRNDPDNDKALTLLGTAYLQQHSTELAESALGQALEINPDNAVAAKSLANLYAGRGDLDKAYEIVRPLVERGIGDGEVFRLYIQTRLAADEWTEATVAAEQFYGEESATSRYVHALVLQEQGDHEAAADTFAALLEENPRSKQLLAALAYTPRITEQPGGTVAFLREQIAADAGNLGAVELLADALLREGRFDEAETLANQTLEAQPTWMLGYDYAARARMNAGDREGAVPYFQAALEQAPQAAGFRLRLASLQEQIGNHEAARDHYRQLLDHPSVGDFAANNLAAMLSRNEATAAEALEVAMRLADSQHPVFADTLGWSYVVNGDTTNGGRLLEFAERELPNLAEVKYHLGVCRFEEGRLPEAAQLLERALAIVEDNPQQQKTIDQTRIRQLLSQIQAANGGLAATGG